MTAVDEGSFSRAAARLFISQPALSQQIQRLERDVGAALIDRSYRPFRLTSAGDQVYALSQRILEDYRGLSTIKSGVRAGEIGRVRLGITPSLLLGSFPEVIRRFRLRFPQVQLTLERFYTVQTDLVTERRVDALFLYSHSQREGVASRALYHDVYCAAFPAEHPLARQDTVELSQLRHETFILPRRQAARGSHDDIIAACDRAGFSPASKEVRGSYLEHVGFVAAGFGVALVPKRIAKFDMPSVVYVPLAKPPKLSVSICWAEDHAGTAVQAVIDHFIDAFAADPDL